MKQKLSPALVEDAYERLKNVVAITPLELNKRLSEKYHARIYLKREDLQVVRSYKVRGAYNRISRLSDAERARGIVCASAGNHAQGVAFSCSKLKVVGHIYMPKNTPKQKVDRVRSLGGKWITMELVGDTFDDAFLHANKYCKTSKKIFIHPFDDVYVMAGQGTVGLEIVKQLEHVPDYVLVPVGGGGLIAGVGAYIKSKNNNVKIVGVEPAGAPSMSRALERGAPVMLTGVDKFVDGAAVKTVGTLTFDIAKDAIDKMLTVPEGKICEEMIVLYQSDGIVAEPAGALSVAGLDDMQESIRNKVVVCIISGGNNDVSRYPEIMDRSLIYQGLKHYFIIEFSQRPGALRGYLDNILGPNDDITLFEYMKKSDKETGPALVGVELSDKKDFAPLLKRMDKAELEYEVLEKESPLFRFLI
jgi:threonine dehydratase